MTRLAVREAPGATPKAAGGGKVLLQIISPGQGSSGYYAPSVLEQAAKDRVFKAGLHSYLDHPSESEQYDRPERSVRDLVGVLTEDARWTGSALVAEARYWGEWSTFLTEMGDAVGVSIRASAEASPRTGGGVDITRIVEADSVDIVTKAGRGGAVLQVLESARPGARGGGAPSQRATTARDVDEAVAAAFGRVPSNPRTGASYTTATEAHADLTVREGQELIDCWSHGRPFRGHYVSMERAVQVGRLLKGVGGL